MPARLLDKLLAGLPWTGAKARVLVVVQTERGQVTVPVDRLRIR